MRRRFRYRRVGVFTDRPLSGNALAVFLDADEVSGAEMQAIARELNLAETTFVLRATAAGRDAGADCRVRIFTPGAELPFAGHPSIGTAWVLLDEGRVAPRGSDPDVRLELAVGVLRVQAADRGARDPSQRLTLTTRPPEVVARLGVDECGRLAAELQVEPSDLVWPDATESHRSLASPAVISCGLPYVVVPFVSLDLLAAVDLSHALALARFAEPYGGDGAALVAPGTSGVVSGAEVHVRVLSDPRVGPPEDAATGSAAGPVCAFLGYLAGRRDETQRVVIEQGVEMGRPSRLEAEVEFGPDGEPVSARVSGNVVPVGEGWIDLP